MKKNKARIVIENCMDCPNHKVLPDPDPDDWFNDDDIKVVCAAVSKDITVACRPYNKGQNVVFQTGVL